MISARRPKIGTRARTCVPQYTTSVYLRYLEKLTFRRGDERRMNLLTVGTCALQNSHDREICARSLRATQESRPSPGAFPPPAPCIGVQQQQQPSSPPQHRDQQRCAMNQVQQQQHGIAVGVRRPHRPASLDIGMTRRCIPPVVGCIRAATVATSTANPLVATPSSAPAICTSRGFFDDGCTVNSNGSNVPPGFELNVNVACSPAGNRGTDAVVAEIDIVFAIFNVEPKES